MVNLSSSNLAMALVITLIIVFVVYYCMKNKRKGSWDKESRDKKSADYASSDDERTESDRAENDRKHRESNFKAHSSNRLSPQQTQNIVEVAKVPEVKAEPSPPLTQKPYNLSAELDDVSTVKLSWNMPSTPFIPAHPEFNSLPLEYAVYRYNEEPVDDNVKPQIIEIAPSTQYVFSNLNPALEPVQYFRVRAANSKAISDFSETTKIELDCGLDVANDEINSRLDLLYETRTGILTWNRLHGVHGYGIFVVADNYHQQFYIRERNGEITGQRGKDPSNTKIDLQPVKVLDLSNIAARNIKAVLFYLVNNCGSSKMLVVPMKQ